MSSKTKIVVLRMKEIIYTAIFIGLGILLILLLLVDVPPEKGKQRRTCKRTIHTRRLCLLHYPWSPGDERGGSVDATVSPRLPWSR